MSERTGLSRVSEAVALLSFQLKSEKKLLNLLKIESISHWKKFVFILQKTVGVKPDLPASLQ